MAKLPEGIDYPADGTPSLIPDPRAVAEHSPDQVTVNKAGIAEAKGALAGISNVSGAAIEATGVVVEAPEATTKASITDKDIAVQESLFDYPTEESKPLQRITSRHVSRSRQEPKPIDDGKALALASLPAGTRLAGAGEKHRSKITSETGDPNFSIVKSPRSRSPLRVPARYADDVAQALDRGVSPRDIEKLFRQTPTRSKTPRVSEPRRQVRW